MEGMAVCHHLFTLLFLAYFFLCSIFVIPLYQGSATAAVPAPAQFDMHETMETNPYIVDSKKYFIWKQKKLITPFGCCPHSWAGFFCLSNLLNQH